MPMEEKDSLLYSLQTETHLGDLREIGVPPEYMANKVVLNIGAGKRSHLRQELAVKQIPVELIEVDGKPLPLSGIRVGTFTDLPVPDDIIDLAFSRNADPWYLPADNTELAVRAIREIGRVLKPRVGEARLGPWALTKPLPNGKGLSVESVMERDSPDIFAAMKSVPGLVFTLVEQGDVDPGTGEVKSYYVEHMVIRKR